MSSNPPPGSNHPPGPDHQALPRPPAPLHAHGTNFAGVEPDNADVIQSDLRGSNIFGAHVNGTNFTDARLTHGNWTGAYLFQTKFLGTHDIGMAKLTPDHDRQR